MIGLALVITAGSFVISLAYLGWATWLTARRDRGESAGIARERP